jgi:hypothetical protein
MWLEAVKGRRRANRFNLFGAMVCPGKTEAYVSSFSSTAKTKTAKLMQLKFLCHN